MKVHLIRHGETDYNQQRRVQGQAPAGVSESGIAQAKAISNELTADKPALIISIPDDSSCSNHKNNCRKS